MHYSLFRQLWRVRTRSTTTRRGPPRPGLWRPRLEQLEARLLPSLVPHLLQDVNLTHFSANPTNFVEVSGTVYLSAFDSLHGQELWKSNGTAAGTVLVKDINPGPGDSLPRYLTNVNGTLFFDANDGTHGSELWRSDGTAAGTQIVKDVNPGSKIGRASWRERVCAYV